MNNIYPNQSLRDRLFRAGIPEPQHNLESLVSFMPLDLNVQTFDRIDVDSIAEMLLYFVAKGLVKPPTGANKVLLDMPWGSHICEFYDSKEGLMQLLVPYFKEGLERNENCIWIVADLTIQEATDALAAAVPDLPERIATGQMKFAHHSEFHTHNGRMRPINTLIDQWEKIVPVANNSAGFRASGSMAWIKDEQDMAEFAAYEDKVHMVINNSRITAVCTYPTKLATMLPAKQLPHSHNKIFVKRGQWVYEKLKDSQEVYAIFDSITKQRPVL
jgi:MEDS: MEthanogen/methylotroph, DcmR Sensory domain